MLFQLVKKFALVAACVVSFGAQAGTIVDVEEVNTKTKFIDSTSWTHNLNDEGFVLGSAESATLSIELWDDGGFLDFGEVATIIIGIIDFQDGQFIYNPINTWVGELGFSSLAGLNAFGLLEVTIANVGDFYIGDSILTVSVPESSSLMLFALGLLGLVALRKRKAA